MDTAGHACVEAVSTITYCDAIPFICMFIECTAAHHCKVVSKFESPPQRQHYRPLENLILEFICESISAKVPGESAMRKERTKCASRA